MCLTALFPPFAVAGYGLLGYGAYCGYQCVRGASKFEKLFKNLKLGIDEQYPIFKKKKSTNYSIIYTFTLPTGLSSQDFENKKLAIEQYLGKDINIQYTYKEIQIEVYGEDMKHYYEYFPIDIKGNVPIFIGYNRKGKEVTCDLSNNEPHMLIAGETGSGKSTALRSLITNLILKSNVKLHLIDLKMGAEFNVFHKSSKVSTFSRTIKECEKVLEDLSVEVDNRYNLFFENDVKDIKEYNCKYPKLNYQILIIDEFADLQSNKKCINLLEELSRKSRACGIHLILSTQRPDANVLNGNIKSNITNVLGLKTLNSINSSIILGQTGLETLKGKGHGLFKRGNIVEVQTAYLDIDKSKELIKHTYIEKKKNIEKFENIDYSLLEVFK